VFLWSTLVSVVVASCVYVVTRDRAGSTRSTAVVENPAHTRLKGMTEKDRAETMTRLLAEEGCDLVVGSFYQGTRHEDGTAFWNFACRNGRRFMVSVKADANGATHVADCGVIKVLGTPCFQELDRLRRR
jgi:hypothetical protein